jgi:DeoR/GlpR family transcriptional regulator of sugar metabolism
MMKRLLSRERHLRICEVLQRQSMASVQALAEELNVSEMTIRRDLEVLERDGRARRTHGGATATDRMVFEIDNDRRRTAHLAAKGAIAAEAQRLIRPGHRIILDAGSTTLELALRLRNYEKLTIITTSLAVASALQACRRIEVILLGGILRNGRPDLTGAVTEQTLELFSADLAFQGADAIDLEGWIYNEDVQSAQVTKKIREKATQTYILSDSSKIGRTALVRCGNLREDMQLITDERIHPEDLEQLRRTLEIDPIIVRVDAADGTKPKEVPVR